MLEAIDLLIRYSPFVLLADLAVILFLMRHWKKQKRGDEAFVAYWDLRDIIRDHFDKDDCPEHMWRSYLHICRVIDREYAATHPGKKFIPLEGVVLDIIGGGDAPAEKDLLVPV